MRDALQYKEDEQLVNFRYRHGRELDSWGVYWSLDLVTGVNAVAIVLDLGIRVGEAEDERWVWVTDWDDTCVPYSWWKVKYFGSIRELVSDDDKDSFTRLCGYLNRVCRVLTPSLMQPVRYSPLLELVCESLVVRYLKKDVKELAESTRDFFELLEKNGSDRINQIEALLAETEAEKGQVLAREFVARVVEHFLKDRLEVRRNIDTDPRPYYVEKRLGGASWEKNKPHRLVLPEIHNAFRKSMYETNEDLSHLKDVPNDLVWIVATFGGDDFQPDKILFGIKDLDRKPDKIIFFLEGRKAPIIRTEVVEKHAKAEIFYFDDSGRQLGELVGEKINLYHAVWEGSKRSEETPPSEATQVRMDEVVDGKRVSLGEIWERIVMDSKVVE